LRGIGFRAVSILIGLSPLVVCEGVLRLAGLGDVSMAEDPYIGFADVQPLFVHNPAIDRFEIPRSRELFQSDSFPAIKGDRESRIFCLGGSTVQGRPYGIETAFSSWLKLGLDAVCPDRDWEVINCGGISYASYRLVPIMQEVLQYEPDLLILYSGHNEFLEDRTYRAVKATPAWVVRAHRWLSSLHSYQLIRSCFAKETPTVSSGSVKSRSILAQEVEALLDYRGGLDAYKRDNEWRAGVVRHYEFNVRRMISIASKAGVPVVLVNPVSNLKDTPPFKTLHREGITKPDQYRFDTYRNEAGSLESTVARRIASLRSAIEIDDQHAGVHFELGKTLEGSGAFDLAKSAYLRAKAEDICPLRMTEPLHAALARVALETSTPWLDARALFEGWTADGIPGNEWLVDHVHPSVRGHQRLAEALCSLVMPILGVVIPEGWQSDLSGRYRDHLEGLRTDYYVKGRQQLEGLRMWSQGRSLKASPRRPGK
jgi:lysophospholipase L1-like esterase